VSYEWLLILTELKNNYLSQSNNRKMTRRSLESMERDGQALSLGVGKAGGDGNNFLLSSPM
jgi:hypothetical protein